MVKIIAISGTHSVGKSTLINQLKEIELPYRILFMDETTDHLRELGFRLSKKVSTGHQFVILNEDFKRMILFSEFLKYTKEYDMIITDRSVMDTKAYIEYETEAKPYSDESQMLQGVANSLERQFLSVYNHTFYIPPEIPLVTEGRRSLDETFRKRVDLHLIQNLNNQSMFVPFTTIKGSREERLASILYHLKETSDV